MSSTGLVSTGFMTRCDPTPTLPARSRAAAGRGVPPRPEQDAAHLSQVGPAIVQQNAQNALSISSGRTTLLGGPTLRPSRARAYLTRLVGSHSSAGRAP